MQFQIHTFATLDSTSSALKRDAGRVPFGTVYRALHQSAGYGRNGRSFYSPAQSGLYFSVLLSPKTPFAATALAAVAMSRAVESICGLQLEIKWLNDLYLHGRKAAGILCESLYENGKSRYLVMGIGLNVHSTGFPDSLQQTACALEDFTDAALDEEQILMRFLEEFSALLDHPDPDSWLQTYRSQLLWKGQSVLVVQGQNAFEAVILDLNPDGSLLISRQGKTLTLSSGDIHLLAS